MDNLNRLVLHPDFERTIKELSDKSIFLPYVGNQDSPHILDFQTSGQLLTKLEEIKGYSLDPKKGSEASKQFLYSAYDESIMKFIALEGSAFFTAHSLIVAGDKEYIPVALATFRFYTRSESIVSKSEHIKFALDPEVEAKRDYMKDRLRFFLDYVPRKSLLFIDGPLIGGDLYTIMVDNNKKFLENEIVPIYFVKNSTSNIVTDNIKELKGKYNSDMHWLNLLLRPGERSAFFKYEDQVNKKNSKVFCYLKAFNSSPQRIEMHSDTFSKYGTSIKPIMDLLYYLLLVQGSLTNPQLRPIAIAEGYARSMIKFLDINQYFKKANITPTLNQVRFGG